MQPTSQLQLSLTVHNDTDTIKTAYLPYARPSLPWPQKCDQLKEFEPLKHKVNDMLLILT